MNFAQELRSEYARLVTRRWFFRQCGVGLGSIALASLPLSRKQDQPCQVSSKQSSPRVLPHQHVCSRPNLNSYSGVGGGSPNWLSFGARSLISHPSCWTLQSPASILLTVDKGGTWPSKFYPKINAVSARTASHCMD